MLQRRNSKQRNVIREYLCGRIDHPTAEKLYKEIRLEHPKMSLGTVYRNLMFLTDIGEIQALDVGDGITHFDPNPMPHAHFYCKKCKRVFDVFMDDYDKIQNIFANNVQGKVESCAVSLTGSCKECSEIIKHMHESYDSRRLTMNKYAGTKTEQNLKDAFAGESQARNKYTYFASVAKKAGYEQIAAIF